MLFSRLRYVTDLLMTFKSRSRLQLVHSQCI